MQKTVAVDRRTSLERNLDDGSDTLEIIQDFADRLCLSIPDALAMICETVSQLNDLELLYMRAKRDQVGLHVRVTVRKDANALDPKSVSFQLR